MTKGDKQKKTPKQTDRGPEFEAFYKKLTSEKVTKASDRLFSASEEDLKKAFKHLRIKP
jgi:hypothetical protein|tara:strand:- start:154 stop:330 length:177 start_codon:yes stop_codon:yes gene_type:complete